MLSYTQFRLWLEPGQFLQPGHRNSHETATQFSRNNHSQGADPQNFENQKSKLGKSNEYFVESISILLRVLYPIAPHITENLWDKVGFVSVYGNLISSKWPEIDKCALQQKEIEIVLQIDGKTRSNLKISATAKNDEIIKAAKGSDAYKKFSSGLEVQKTIIVPNRLINIVLAK